MISLWNYNSIRHHWNTKHIVDETEEAKFLRDLNPRPSASKCFAWAANTLVEIVSIKVATTLVDLLFIELVLHLSHAKKVYGQPMHLSHELIFWWQITRKRVNFSFQAFGLDLISKFLFGDSQPKNVLFLAQLGWGGEGETLFLMSSIGTDVLQTISLTKSMLQRRRRKRKMDRELKRKKL